MRIRVAALALAGCASGGTSAVSDAPGNQTVDAKEFRDGPIEPQTDAAIDAPKPIDAHPDAPVDAHPDAPPDACVPVTTELLVNPVLDLTPVGANWTETSVIYGGTTYFPITADGPYAPQSAPYKAWMGGFAGTDLGVSSYTDQLYQDITVPPNTTQLVLSGYYTVGTNENPNDAPYDTANLDLLQTNGTPIEAVLALTNLTNTGAVWTPFSHPFATNVSGMTVRIRVTSTNDITNATNFFFDTFALNATHCP